MRPALRSYGRSSGLPSTNATLADIAAVFKCLLERFNKQPQDIILYGQSVGGGLIAPQQRWDVRLGRVGPLWHGRCISQRRLTEQAGSASVHLALLRLLAVTGGLRPDQLPGVTAAGGGGGGAALALPLRWAEPLAL